MSAPFEVFLRVMAAQRERNSRQYRHWVVKRVQSQFESHIRNFDRSTHDGRIIGPVELLDATNGRLMADLESILRRYQIAESEIVEAAKTIRERLCQKWRVSNPSAKAIQSELAALRAQLARMQASQ